MTEAIVAGLAVAGALLVVNAAGMDVVRTIVRTWIFLVTAPIAEPGRSRWREEREADYFWEREDLGRRAGHASYGPAEIALRILGRLIAGIPEDVVFSLSSIRERTDATEDGVQAASNGGHVEFGRGVARARSDVWIPLTQREHDIIAGVLAGRSNDELSADLSIARTTVEAYLTRLYVRFDVLTRTELAILAVREQWLSLPVRVPNVTNPRSGDSR